MGEALWLLNIGLFALFTALYAARWVFFFDGARRIFGHSVGVDVLWLHPDGAGDHRERLLIFGPARLGPAAVEIATTLWWIDVALAVACGLAIPYMMFTRQEHSIDQMTAVWLLPMVAAGWRRSRAVAGAASGRCADAACGAVAVLCAVGAVGAGRDGRAGHSAAAAGDPQAAVWCRWRRRAGWRWGPSTRARWGC